MHFVVVQTRVISCDVESEASATVASVVVVCLLTTPFGDLLPMLLTYESFLRTCAILATADLEVIVGGSAGTRKSETAAALSDLIDAADVPQFGEAAGKLEVLEPGVVVCEGGL